MREIAALALALALTALACSRAEDNAARCARAFDHYARLLAAEGNDGEAAPPEVVARARAALGAPGGAAQCEAEMTESRYRCALAATGPDDFERCFVAP